MIFKNKIGNNTNSNSPLGVRGSFLFLLLISFQLLSAQSPKRELRSTWLTTVWRLDWPSVTVPKATGTNDAARQAAILQQKNELISILDSLKAANMNATFLQVRSMCDAMYQSSYEPWSSFISGERGADPGYDPLAFAIVEAHKRGIELHAWLNPYRYSTSSTTHGELPTDYYNTHRDWLLAYDSYTKILNPGYPQVVMQIKKIVGEIVNNYDVDGIVFDDYFYAYGGTSATLDSTAQRLYKPADKNINDWRRENVNRMIAAVYDTIQKVKPYVTFGVSPFGTWTTDVNVAASRGILLPTGVGATGNMYAEIYCDPLAWLEQGTVDYLSPQLYWTTYSAYPYGALAYWWSDITNRFGKHFYPSHSLSSLAASAPAASGVVKLQNENIKTSSLSTLEVMAVNRKTLSRSMRAPEATSFAPSEIALQVDFNRKSDLNDAPGSVFYATDKTVNTTGFIRYLKKNIFTQPALCPAISWKAADNQTLVENISLTGQTLTWTYSASNIRFAVYAVPNANRNDTAVFSSSKYLLGVSYNHQYELPATVSSVTHKIAVSVLDRYGNEFSQRILGESLTTTAATELVYPVENTQALIPCVFRWNSVAGVDSYVWQLARDAQFTDLVCSRETTLPQFFSGLQTNLKDGVEYFWRVKTRKPNAADNWSQPNKFRAHKFQITYPANGSGSIPLIPTMLWDSVSATASYKLEISTAADFSLAKQVLVQTLQIPNFTFPSGKLMPGSKYYARVSVTDGLVKATSETIQFTTLEVPISVPQLISPITGSTILGTTIQICWNEQASKGFRAELSKDATFPARATTVKSVDASTYCALYENLTAATYYLRVKAATNEGLTDPSATVTVILNDNTSVDQIQDENLKCFVRTNGSGKNDLIIQSNSAFMATISLFSLTGTAIQQIETSIKQGENQIDLIPENLPRGVYPVLIQTKSNKIPFKIIL
ncbi:MAG: family 10 glycosylhydrolase [Paludibacter sp.]